MKLSILTVSKTASNLNNLIRSIQGATTLPATEIEILCSWNGTSEEEAKIINHSGLEFLIAQRESYHFSSNMNKLAEKTTSPTTLFISDDVILDEGSIDAAINCLNSSPDAGIIGANLRYKNGNLSHTGANFSFNHSAYQALDNLIAADSGWLNSNREVPAVVGAFMLISRSNFMKVKFNESYQKLGEDTELCLSIRKDLGLKIISCTQASGIHVPETTRSITEKQSDYHEDIARLRAHHFSFQNEGSKDDLLVELEFLRLESHILRELIGELAAKAKEPISDTILSRGIESLERENINLIAQLTRIEIEKSYQEKENQKIASKAQMLANSSSATQYRQ